MSYKLEKPFTDIQRANFICEHQGLNYYEDDNCIIMYPNTESVIDGVVTDISQTPEYISEQAQKEAERIARLHLRRGDVFRGLLKAKGVTKTQLRAMIEAMPDGIDKEEAFIDFDDALEFYRGVALVDTIGAALGITSNQMTEFFETNDYQKLNT
jgi:hypothetical protein